MELSDILKLKNRESCRNPTMNQNSAYRCLITGKLSDNCHCKKMVINYRSKSKNTKKKIDTSQLLQSR